MLKKYSFLTLFLFIALCLASSAYSYENNLHASNNSYCGQLQRNYQNAVNKQKQAERRYVEDAKRGMAGYANAQLARELLKEAHYWLRQLRANRCPGW